MNRGNVAGPTKGALAPTLSEYQRVQLIEDWFTMHDNRWPKKNYSILHLVVLSSFGEET